MEEQLCSEIEQCSWGAISGNGCEEGRRIMAKEEAKSFKRSHELVWSRNRTTEKQNTSGIEAKINGGGSHEALADNDVLLPPTLPIPRVKFPRKASIDQNPADLRAQMTKELSRRVSSVLDDEEATHCYRPSSLVPISTKSSLRAKHQNVDYILHGTGYKLLDPDGIYDLFNWHESERKRLKAELEGLPQADLQGRQVGYTYSNVCFDWYVAEERVSLNSNGYFLLV